MIHLPKPTNCADVDPEIFFDENRVAIAKKLCATCYFQLGCRALGADEEYGVWGGRPKTPVEMTDRDDQILSLLRTGLSQSEVAAQVGVSQYTVSRTAHRFRSTQEVRDNRRKNA